MWINTCYNKERIWIDDRKDFYDILEEQKPITKEKAINIIEDLAETYSRQAGQREKIDEKKLKRKKYRDLLYSSFSKEYECGFAYGLRTAKAILECLELGENNNEV